MHSFSSLAQSLRFRYGLFWGGRYPAPPYRLLFATVVVAAMVTAAYHYDNLKLRIAELEWYQPMAETLLACMSAGDNGQRGGFYFPDSQKAYACEIYKL